MNLRIQLIAFVTLILYFIFAICIGKQLKKNSKECAYDFSNAEEFGDLVMIKVHGEISKDEADKMRSEAKKVFGFQKKISILDESLDAREIMFNRIRDLLG